MSEFQSSNFKKENGGTPDLLGKTELTSPYFFVPPSGTTAERPSSCAPGTLRFNTDIGTLEVYKGDTIGWQSIQRRESQYLGGGITPNLGSNAGTGTRGLTLAGDPATDEITFFTVSTLGNAQDFGNLTQSRKRFQGFASSTRAFALGGAQEDGSGGYNIIDFVTVSSTGNATNFGDQTTAARSQAGASNSTRGITAGGTTGFPSGSFVDTIEYVTMQSAGNTVDFGNLTQARDFPTAVNSSVRIVFAGGAQYPTAYNNMDFITTASLGNATDFGDLTGTSQNSAAVCNSTRGVIAKCFSGGYLNNLEFITIASLGNSVDFGDRIHTAAPVQGASYPTRGVFAGGYAPGGTTNAMEFIEIATTGNGTDFGDMVNARGMPSVVSNGHGGL